VVANRDVFDLRQALAGIAWNGTLDILSKFLRVTVVNNGADLQVAIAGPGGSAITIATLAGRGQQTLAAFEQRALL
jgi:hypothetical protein